MTAIDEARRLADLSEDEYRQQFINHLAALPKPVRPLCPDCGRPMDKDFMFPGPGRYYCEFCKQDVKMGKMESN